MRRPITYANRVSMSLSAKKSVGLAALLLCSMAWAVNVLGRVPLDIHNTRWLWGDLSLVYLSWSHYIADPNAHGLMSTRMSFPLEMNISLFDPMPIFVLTFGKLHQLVSQGQYIGWYFAICLVLQGLFGYLVMTELIKPKEKPTDPWRELIKIVGALFFVLTPYTFFRFQGHTALSSQWVLVLSMWVSLRTQNTKTPGWILANGVVLFLASGINPYITFMAAMSMGAMVVASPSEAGAIPRLLRLLALALIALSGFYVFGFIGAAAVTGGGYGAYSMNILGPIDSNGMARLFSLDVPDATASQSFEGFSYIGLGLILMLITSLGLAFRPNKHLEAPPWRAIALVVIVSYVLALSSTITLAGWNLHLPLPDLVESLLNRFRASGRFFWIGSFWLIVLGIFGIASRLNAKQATLLLALLLTIQLVDVMPIASNVRQGIAEFKRQTLSEWDANLIPQNTEAIVVIPPWQCSVGRTPGGPRNYEIFGFLSRDLNIPTNNFYAARTLPEQREYHCNAHRTMNEISTKNVYFLSQDFFQKYQARFSKDFLCKKSQSLRKTYICTPKPAYP